MNPQTTETSEKLVFNSIKSGRHTASGILTDDDGNIFSVEVKGTNKAEVEKFIKYELEQASKGDGITTGIKPLSKKEHTAIKKARKADLNLIPVTGPLEQSTWHGISIKVKALHLQNVPDKPHKIRIVIDPPIEDGKSMDFPIEMQEDADIKCEVSKGKVSLELYEFVGPEKSTTILRETQNASPGKPAEFHAHRSQGTTPANWNFRVTGKDPAVFKLTLDLNKL